MSNTYTVQAGDTLSEIAQRHASSVAELRQLNPFIRNSDHIQPGWNLSLPAKPQQSARPAPTSEAGAATTATPLSPATAGKVLQLDPKAVPPPVSQESFCKDQSPPCNPRYADILYETGQRKFWLLRQKTLDDVWEAADQLGQKVVLGDTDTRLKGLDDSGLLDYFLEPKLSNFLVGEEKARLEEIETNDPDLEANAEEADLFRDSLNSMNPVDRADLNQYDREQLAEGQRLTRLRAEKRKLEAKARGVAEEQGYTVENGQLFTPEAMQLRGIVQTYLAERDKLLAMDLPSFEKIEVDQYLANHKVQLEQVLEGCEFECYTNLYDFLKWSEENKPQRFYAAYSQAIMSAAEYGLALPEYALLSNVGADIQQGVNEFKKYLGTLRAQRIIEAEIEKKHRDWISATGKETSAPSGLCAAEREQWFALKDQLDELENQAKTNVAALRPTRHLLWKPEEFQPRPLERLVRSDFPLREFSLAKTQQRLSHLSVGELFRLLGEDAAQIIKEDLRALPGKVKDASEGEGRSLDATDTFGYWLQQQDAFPIGDQGPWFTEAGEFDPERFKAYLNKQKLKVDSLEDATALAEWGNYLKQMIFEDSARKRLRLFDHSPQARLIRCLTPPQSNIYINASAKGPDIGSAPDFSASLDLTLDINLARGEVDIGEFEYPPRAQAINKPLLLSYYDYQDTIQLHTAPVPGQLQDDGWCTLAGLGASLSGGAGVGLKGDFSLGLENKQLVLRMKASVFAGPGVDGEFNFVVGYQAIGWLLHLFSSELNKNQYRPLRWVTPEAFDYLYGLNAMAVVGINIQTLFLAGYDVSMRTYQALTAGRRAGPVAFTITTYDKPEELRQWAVNVIPEALGALLHTLLAEPQEFTIVKIQAQSGSTVKTEEEPFSEVRANLFQQQAIEQLLRWIVNAATNPVRLVAAQRQFEEAVTRMKTGKAKPAKGVQAYCANLKRMNDFMAVPVMRHDARDSDDMRARYKEHVKLLGAHLEGVCSLDGIDPVFGGMYYPSY